MAMNKAEKAAFESLKDELYKAKAFRFTETVLPDIPIPGYVDKPTSGWVCNVYSMRVGQAWSTSVAHGNGSARTPNSSGSQRGIPLYSTKLLALRAMRNAAENEYASKLASIDRLIEEEGDPHDTDT